ncbi:MAG TPA: nucleotide exchange factor GrpE [Mycobacteriales bacterium]|nr:nucleotide exchange factor GrpE [Mycobacteriales bacterium]
MFDRGNRQRGVAASPVGPAPAVPAPGGGMPEPSELTRLRDERAALIDLCLYARDRVNSPAAADRIDAALVDLGVTALRPDGEPFDPARHEASAGVPTANATLHGTVAETEVPGYADRGRMVRPPVVAVYRCTGERTAASESPSTGGTDE